MYTTKDQFLQRIQTLQNYLFIIASFSDYPPTQTSSALHESDTVVALKSKHLFSKALAIFQSKCLEIIPHFANYALNFTLEVWLIVLN